MQILVGSRHFVDRLKCVELQPNTFEALDLLEIYKHMNELFNMQYEIMKYNITFMSSVIFIIGFIQYYYIVFIFYKTYLSVQICSIIILINSI